jgi:hypothetical protein
MQYVGTELAYLPAQRPCDLQRPKHAPASHLDPEHRHSRCNQQALYMTTRDHCEHKNIEPGLPQPRQYSK